MRAIQDAPLTDKGVKTCQLVIRHRASEEADDPLTEPGPLQADAVNADAVNLDELRLMLRTLDRTTVRGKRDAAVLLIAWWMAARASAPARLNLHDARITTVHIEDEHGGTRPHQALVIKIRRSKADQAARGQEVRILAPADQELCPIHALRMARRPRRRRPAHPRARCCAASTGTATSAPRPPGRPRSDDRRPRRPAHPRPNPHGARRRGPGEARGARGRRRRAHRRRGQRHPQDLARERAFGPRRRPPHHRPQHAPRLDPAGPGRRQPARDGRPALTALPAQHRLRRLPGMLGRSARTSHHTACARTEPGIRQSPVRVATGCGIVD
ncbi:hypothetical protein ACFS5L_40400 [Streptomyces phyllanthi]